MPVLGCRGQKIPNMSTVTKLVAGIFGSVSSFPVLCRQIDVEIFHICLSFFIFVPSSNPKNLDFAVTDFVAVLIFATFWPEHISNPCFKGVTRPV